MTFDEILEQVITLLQRQRRVSYRALKRRFDLDEDYLEDVKVELIKAQHLARDEDGEILVWVGEAGGVPLQTPPRPPLRQCVIPPTGFSPFVTLQALLRWFLHFGLRSDRVTRFQSPSFLGRPPPPHS